MLTLNRETLMRAYPQTPQNVNLRIDQTLCEIRKKAAEQHPAGRYATRLSLVTVLVIVLLLMATIGIAAGVHFGVFDFMGRMFGHSDVLPQANELIQTELALFETKHATITLSQAVYDGGNLRIVYSVRQRGAAKPLTQDELDDESSDFRTRIASDGITIWGCDWFYIDGAEYVMTGGSLIETIPGTENGQALCYMDIYLASSGITPQEDFKVQLPVVRHGRNDYETLDFTVRAAVTATAAPALHAKGATVTVVSASLSPVRAYVTLRVEMDEGATKLQTDTAFADWQDAQLVDRDGNPLAEISEFWMNASTEGKSAEYSFTFLPTDAAEAYIAPTIITQDDQWLVDMTQAILVK